MTSDRSGDALKIAGAFVAAGKISSRDALENLLEWSKLETPQSFLAFLKNRGLIDSTQELLEHPATELCDRDLTARKVGLSDSKDSIIETMDYRSLESSSDSVSGLTDVPDQVSERTIAWTLQDESDELKSRASEPIENRFEISRQFAEGGLGVVYVAKDKQFQRYVALKKVRHDRATSEAISDKFLFEAEVTGQLEHPGIVPVYALGTDSLGQPFYAMRFIRGQELKHSISQLHLGNSPSRMDYDSLPFRQLLKHFIDVCLTIEYAHSRGVIHRDLKPANIMLGAHGETLVVDWGLAKSIVSTPPLNVVDSVVSEQSPIRFRQPGVSGSQTMYGSFSGTVAYAPPEQLLGELDKLGPATDIYSLGAILFELLTGRVPIQKKIRSITEVVELIRDGRELEPKKICPKVPRSLSAICQKAMAYEISGRYTTARDLADDIERWLSDERVLAIGKTETAIERFGRLLRRHRTWTIPIALALVLTSVVTVASAVLINRARIQEQAAKKVAIENKTAAIERIGIARNAIDSMLIDSTDLLGDIPATRQLQLRLLSAARNEYDRLSHSDSSDPSLKLESIRALVRVADIDHLRQDYAAAAKKYDAAIESLEAYLGTAELVDRVPWEIELAKTHARRGLAYDIEAKFDFALKEFETAIEQFRKLRSSDTADSLVAGLLARSLAQLGDLIARIDDPRKAINYIKESIELLSQLESDSTTNSNQIAVVIAYESLARSLGRSGDSTQALEICRTIEGALTKSTADPRIVKERLASLGVTRASLFRSDGQLRQAVASLELSLENYQSLLHEFPDDLRYDLQHALTLVDVGLIAMDLGEITRARALLTSGEASFRRLHSAYPQSAEYRDGLATSLCGLAQIGIVCDADAKVAIDSLRQAQALWIELARVSEEPQYFVEKWAGCVSHLARALARSGDLPAAKVAFKQSSDLFEQLIQAETQEPRYFFGRAEMLWHQGWVLWQAKEQNLAAGSFESACEALRQLIKLFPQNADYCAKLSRYLVLRPDKPQRNASESLDHAQKALQLQPRNQVFMLNLARSFAMASQADFAERSLESYVQNQNSQDIELAIVFAKIALLKSNPAEARRQVNLAQDWLQETLPYDYPMFSQVTELAESLASASGNEP